MRDVPGASLVLVIVVAACGYRAGSFALGRSDVAGARATYGCVDVDVSRRADHPGGPVLAYEFGNGCDHAVSVDLAAIPVVARDGDLQPYDPDRELRALPLDGRSTGGEAIEYRSAVARRDDVICARPGAAFGYDDRGWVCLSRSAEVVGP